MLPSLFLLLLSCLLVAGYEDLVVQTSAGPVQGYVDVSRGGHTYIAFTGIPYAKPPIGALRFMPPQPVDPWKEVRRVMEPGAMCPLIDIHRNSTVSGQEDCLNLSVFTKDLERKSPVVVHIPGAAWPREKGPQFLMDSEIVVVDFNFRTGILGYLSFEDNVAPGNMGLKDQVMVLKWVQENIEKFGGDPDQVTLMGECSGASSAYHHMLSPLSAGLFHRVIAEGGSSFTVLSVSPPGYAKERAIRIADQMRCKGTTAEMISCLQKADVVELIKKLPTVLEWQIDPVLTFGPVMETESQDAFLVGPSSKWIPPKIPLLTGLTSAEGLLRTMHFTHNFDFTILNNDGFNNKMPITLMIRDTSTKPNDILPKIKDYYLSGNEISMNVFKNLTDMIGDAWFSYGILEGAKFSQGDVYVFYFDYIGDVTKSQFVGDKSKATGAFHNDEVLYLWQIMEVPPFKEQDYELSLTLLKMWSNFIMTGNPTPDDQLGFTWTKYNPEENYLAIRNSGITMEKGLFTDRYNFWRSLNFRDKL